MPVPSAAAGPSLEALVERGWLALDSLHPGGLELTRELVALCRVDPGARLLDVACGTGESACDVAGHVGAQVVGIDAAPALLRIARDKAAGRGLDIGLVQGDAQQLPFADDSVDAVICECTLCFLDERRTLAEMCRVTRPGGWVGMHDLCWRPGAPQRLKRALARLESEHPETLDGWAARFREAGLGEIEALDRSTLKARWLAQSRHALGVAGQLRVGLACLREWGVGGLLRVLRSQQVFASRHLGYALVVGRKAAA